MLPPCCLCNSWEKLRGHPGKVRPPVPQYSPSCINRAFTAAKTAPCLEDYAPIDTQRGTPMPTPIPEPQSRSDMSPYPTSLRPAPLAPHYLHLLAPALIQRHQHPLHTRRKIAQHHLGRRMHAQRRRDEIQPRRTLGQPHAAEVSMPLELSQPAPLVRILLMMPAHAHPVIEPL